MSLGRGTLRRLRRAVRAARVTTVARAGVLGASTLALVLPAVGAGATTAPQKATAISSACPWASPAYDATYTPSELAAMVVAKMTLAEKFGMINLHVGDGYENRTAAIPSLCIPSLTLQDGPNGLAYGDTGVTQFPASLGLAATFDVGLARRYGAAEGNEARRQGIDVVQGPNLNVDRIPESGREFEGYGEDPYLVSEMGVADIEGIQSAGVMADAKHFTGYTQETDRINLNQDVANRVIQEVYNPPFKAAVIGANVASVMCSYGSINDVGDCSSPGLYRLLYGGWGFKGFVRSDLAAVDNAPAAFAAGMDAIKPAATSELLEAIASGDLPIARVDNAVERILTEMFTYGLIQHRVVGRIGTTVTNPAHTAVALAVAERSMVLLKNRGQTLPLNAASTKSIAVIGSDAFTGAMTAGFGSAHVVAPFRSTPLDAIRATVGAHATLLYAPGGSSTTAAPAIPLAKFTITGSRVLADRLEQTIPPLVLKGMVGTGSFENAEALLRHATASITVPESGTYVFSLESNGDAWLSVNGHPVVSSPGLHARSSWSNAVALVAGRRATVKLTWYGGLTTGMPVVGMRNAVSPLADAVAAARRSKVAVVFASDVSAEGTDRASISLPSDENALINAVASVNRHTVVVLNTGGAVLMPWIGKVAAVLEAWYPGEEDGRATAAVLFGKVDPSGHLPITFPATTAQVPSKARSSFPGVAGTVDYSEGLDVGYRSYLARGIQPLFPFGYGLSYTTFAISGLTELSTAYGATADVTVTNTGRRAGTDVIQAYLAFPAAAGEPPLQLKAFSPVTLAPGASAVVPLGIAPSSFEAYLTGGWQTVAGSYELYVGDSVENLPLSVALPAPVAIAPSKTPS
jgi:beta-glucosidase